MKKYIILLISILFNLNSYSQAFTAVEITAERGGQAPLVELFDEYFDEVGRFCHRKPTDDLPKVDKNVKMLDYQTNVGPGSRGFHVAGGVDHRVLRIWELFPSTLLSHFKLGKIV